MLRERPFSLFITSDNLPPLRFGQYRFFVWDEWQQPRGFAIVFPTGESAGGLLDDHIEESTNQRHNRINSVELLLTWLQIEQAQPLPHGWRNATDTEAAAILHDWRKYAA
jgi:hypothetical protein